MKKNIFKEQFDKLLTEDLEENPNRYDDLGDDPDESQDGFEDTLDA